MTRYMKTAISVPEDLFEAAEALAERLGMSRSELFSTALRRFVEVRGAEHVTAALDEAYADAPDVDEIAFLTSAARETMSNDGW